MIQQSIERLKLICQRSVMHLYNALLALSFSCVPLCSPGRAKFVTTKQNKTVGGNQVLSCTWHLKKQGAHSNSHTLTRSSPDWLTTFETTRWCKIEVTNSIALTQQTNLRAVRPFLQLLPLIALVCLTAPQLKHPGQASV